MRYPLSSVQREVWFEQSMYPGAPVCNIGGYKRITGPIDLQTFRQALIQLLQETEVLRLALTEQDGVPLQAFPDTAEIDFGYRDCSHDDDPLETALALMQQAIRRPFRIGAEPLFRYALYKLSDESYLWSHTYHHLVVDGWAIALIVERVAALYHALMRGRWPPTSQGVPYRYAVAHDAAYLASTRFERDRRYWQQVFSSLPEPLLSHGGGDAGRTELIPGSVHTWWLPRAQYNRLEAVAQACRVSVFHVWLGLLYVYFTRVQDRDGCVIGVPVLNRHTPAFKQTIGLFASMIPARFDLGRSIDFAGLVQAIARTLRESYRSQRFPVSEINRLAGALQAGRTRLFDLSLSFGKHDYGGRFFAGSPSESGVVVLNHGLEQMPLSVFVFDYTEGQDVQVDFSYNLAYFDADRIGRLEGRFMHLVEEVLAHPERRIGDLDLIPPAERQRMLADGSAPAIPVAEACVHQLFEAQVARTPDALAVVCEDDVLSYASLNARANQLAHTLIARGVGPEGRVAIALERSPALVVALKAGGAYVPLDPDYPAARLAFVLVDSGAQLLVTQEALRSRLPSTTVPTLSLDIEAAALPACSARNPSPPPAPAHLTYILYTSGSTGTPRGVMIPHDALANHMQWMQRAYPLSADDRVLQKTPSSFDASVWEFFAPLLAGATLVMARPGGHQDPDYLVETIRHHGITTLQVVPSQLRVLVEADGFDQCRSLRRVFAGGEALHAELAARFFTRSDADLVNLYGPTEVTIDAVVWTCSRRDAEIRVPIGRPIDNTSAYVLDERLEPRPSRATGELYLGGAGLARGYLGAPSITAERFLPDPFSLVPGARLYRTGDLVRHRHDGQLEFLGRLDQQVKLRGFRIEPGEIETALVAHPSVREAVVLSRAEDGGDARLVAYVVAVGAAPEAGALRGFLRRTLPDYMLPAAIVFLPSLPLAPNGKIDRQALPAPDAGRRPDTLAPRDALEEILAGVWTTGLHQATVGIHDDFFALGGHSLLATQVTARLRDMLGLTVPVRWLLEAPTIALLAARIRAAGPHGAGTASIPANRIRPGTTRITPDLLPLVTLSQTVIDQVTHTVEGGAANVQDIYPLTPLQEGLLFHHRLQDRGDAYLSYALLGFASFARRETFVAALRAVIARHDILRTAVVWEPTPEPLQVVWRQVELPVERRQFDPAQGPVASQLVECRHPRRTRLDLTRAPLLRVVLAEDGASWWLLFLFHHLIMDHTALEVVQEEIGSLLAGDAGRLPAPVPFRTFVAQARSVLPAADHEAFFRDMLQTVTTPTAPFGLFDVRGDGAAIREARRALPADLAQRLRAQARRAGATPASICHLAWALVLARCCGQDSVVFGTVLLGRLHGGDGVERALGLFMNTLPIRLTCDARPVHEALQETQRRLLALLRHEHAPLSLAQRCSGVPGPTPLFSSLLNYRHSLAPGTNRALDGVDLRQTEERTSYPVALSVDDWGGGFDLAAQLDHAVDPARVCAFMENALEAVVGTLENAPHTALCALDILTAEERHRLLAGWNGTAAPVPEACVHKLF